MRLVSRVQDYTGYSTGKHEFACIPIAAVHNNTGSVYDYEYDLPGHTSICCVLTQSQAWLVSTGIGYQMWVVNEPHKSTQPSILCGKSPSAFGLITTRNWQWYVFMLAAYGWTRGPCWLTAAQRSVCIHLMNQVNSCNGYAMTTEL